MRRRMTSAELDAIERRQKALLLFFAVTLMLDVVVLFTVSRAGLARFACWLIAIVSGCICALALRRLHGIGAMTTGAGYASDVDGIDAFDVADALSDLADHGAPDL